MVDTCIHVVMTNLYTLSSFSVLDPLEGFIQAFLLTHWLAKPHFLSTSKYKQEFCLYLGVPESLPIPATPSCVCIVGVVYWGTRIVPSLYCLLCTQLTPKKTSFFWHSEPLHLWTFGHLGLATLYNLTNEDCELSSTEKSNFNARPYQFGCLQIDLKTWKNNFQFGEIKCVHIISYPLRIL